MRIQATQVGVLLLVLVSQVAVSVEYEKPSSISIQYGNQDASYSKKCTYPSIFTNHTLEEGQKKQIFGSSNSYTYNGTGIVVTCLGDCSSTPGTVVETVPYVPLPLSNNGSMVYSIVFTSISTCYSEWIRAN